MAPQKFQWKWKPSASPTDSKSAQQQIAFLHTTTPEARSFKTGKARLLVDRVNNGELMEGRICTWSRAAGRALRLQWSNAGYRFHLRQPETLPIHDRRY